VTLRSPQRAADITSRPPEELQYVGVLCVEFFVSTDGELLVNEIAPRPHNSGTSHVRRRRDQPVRTAGARDLGAAARIDKAVTPAAAMANLLGELWEDGEPNWAAASRFNDVKLHLYGKNRRSSGRKMGHMTRWGERLTKRSTASSPRATPC
jgi:5-(carboxyamino)imidazole ribonucleotide synthase